MKENQGNGVFKPAKKTPSDRADQATVASRAIMEQEKIAREKKTARLRQLRLEKEAAEEAANPGAAPKEKRKAQKRK
ncbi:hypothetical protein [Sinorhizobium mexicanum]|uniref:Uncharacterized protein n=1 Tax=Sinorhizobium mexicanum TaxID=375549 RepID=A0A859QLC3_9HYPH|nr:hypothetical protein [Sinorhizobium mexicanum]MBP1883240.1 hypothetical protein [Sinorhizobium mexicanum]QLL62447.1 hypothetical protein FKV68_13880 [Sinorhizobium mexicanum]